VQVTANVTVTQTPVVAVSISPSSASVSTLGTIAFTALVTGSTDTSVTWSVREASGCGSITQAGLYTAPATASTCHVVATSNADSTKSAIAAVTVSPSPPSTGSCASEPMRATGTTYHYCDCGTGAAAGCVAGNDANAGTSPSAPKRTGFYGRFTTMAAGDTVALCRGGSFSGTANNTRNSNCRASSTCDMRDYTDPRFTLPAGETRPIIRGNAVGYFPDDGSHYEGFRFFNLQSANGDSGVGVFNGSADTTDVDICNIYFHDGGLGIYWADPIVARWTLRQSYFERMQGGILGGCTDCVVDNNFFANTSYIPNSNRDHPLYISGTPVQRMKITNNEIHGCPPGVTSGTVLLVVHSNHTDLLIENNLVQCDNYLTVDGGGYGIALDNGAYTDSNRSQFLRTIVRRNRIVNTGDYAIALSQAPDSVIEDNVVIMPPGSDGYHAIVTGHIAPRGAPNNDAINTRITIRNNTVYSASSAITGINVGLEGTGYIVTNNVIYYGGGSIQCFSYELPAASYSLLANNACNGTWGTTYDTNRVVLTGSPFVSAGTDFTPLAGSPLVDAGTSATNCSVGGSASQPCYSPTASGTVTWSSSDTGRTRTPPIDIGAFER
jgi:hypothetical protein